MTTDPAPAAVLLSRLSSRHPRVAVATVSGGEMELDTFGVSADADFEIGDMARLGQALLDGAAPGTAARDPVAAFAGPAARIGAAWITLEVNGRHVTWHNGATGGFRSWMGLDRAAGTGVVVLSASSGPVDRHGFALLQGLTAWANGAGQPPATPRPRPAGAAPQAGGRGRPGR
ncbi:hypothetical protein [Arthrobacter sp. UYCu712]|uniref:hypothetical protein n=1 Tax=Arthrobacter sp. UYCu712 TaxID=3156340 RepID=UPI00339773F0